MKCPVCSAELPSTARFCGSCGTTLTAPPPPIPASQPSPHAFDPPPAFEPPPSFEPPRPAINQASPWAANAPPTVVRKYKMLRLIAVLMKIIAVAGGALLVIGGVIMLIAGAVASGRSSTPSTPLDTGPAMLFGGVVGGLIMIVYGVLFFVFLYAYSEWMYVFMDIEENTRKTNEMLMGRN